MSGVHKKVIVRLHRGGFHAGYLASRQFVEAGKVDLLAIDGIVKPFDVNDIRLIAFVTDFNSSDLLEPESLGRRAFLSKPRGHGLWLRVTFSDGTTLEGLSAADVRFADELATDQGLFLTPPDPKSNAHRVFVPRAAMSALELLAVIGAAALMKPKPIPASRSQPGLFEDR